MDSMEVNKAVAAILVAGIAFFITGLLGDNLIYDEPPAKPPAAFPTAAPTGGAPAAPAGPESIIPLLASANVQKGQQFVEQVCAACHSFNKGGKPIVGPNLYGIVDDPHDHESGFAYSAALEKFKGQPWDYEALNHWLYDPQTYAPGTHMTYTGIKNTQTRADVIAYLRTLSDKPVALPSADEVKKAQAAEAAQQKAAAPPAAAAAAGPSGPPDIDPMLASANVHEGDNLAHQICAVCHSLNKGGPAVVGPNLYGIVGDPHDHMQGFDYSAALEKYKGKPWTYEELNKWLYDPQTYAPGTRMTYTGVKSTQQRADLIAYLRTLADNPKPLPASAQPTKAAEKAPASGTAAPAGNHSATATASGPNSAPSSSPNVVGPPGKAYNAEQQTQNAGTQAGGAGQTPPSSSAGGNKP